MFVFILSFYLKNDRPNEDIHLLPSDLARIRLFSDVSSGFGDDSNLLIE
jgi:hypothetical protein